MMLDGVSSALCVPFLGGDGRPLGAAYCCTRDPLETYSRDDLQFLMLVTGQLATAVAYRQMISELEESQRRL